MRLELNIPDSALTPTRRSKYTQLVRRFQAHPELIDTVAIKAPPKKGKPEPAKPLTPEELAHLKELDGTFGLLEDVPEEVIDRIEEGIRRMKKEGFPVRA